VRSSRWRFFNALVKDDVGTAKKSSSHKFSKQGTDALITELLDSSQCLIELYLA
jgi:hypothetical protein